MMLFQKHILSLHILQKECTCPDSTEMGVWIGSEFWVKMVIKICDMYIVNLEINNFKCLFEYIRK
jgi:hypothetical protein